jgi:succinate-acetate transporter protein
MERMIKDTTANPAPIGLFGFGATTMLLNLHNAGLFELNNMIMMMGLMYGGIAQFVAGVLENKKGNTFGSTAFISYGSFWWTLVGLWLGNKYGIFPTDHIATGWYMAVWGLISFIFFIGTLNGPTIGKLVFGTLVTLFAVLSAHFFLESAALGKVAGYVGIVCASFAIYEAGAIVLNDKYGRQILPLG